MINSLKIVALVLVLSAVALASNVQASERPAELDNMYESAQTVSATITGRVVVVSQTVKKGLALAQVSFEVKRNNNWVIVGSAATNQNGEYNFLVPLKGLYRITAEKNGYSIEPQSIIKNITNRGVYNADFFAVRDN